MKTKSRKVQILVTSKSPMLTEDMVESGTRLVFCGSRRQPVKFGGGKEVASAAKIFAARLKGEWVIVDTTVYDERWTAGGVCRYGRVRHVYHAHLWHPSHGRVLVALYNPKSEPRPLKDKPPSEIVHNQLGPFTDRQLKRWGFDVQDSSSKKKKEWSADDDLFMDDP